MSGSAVTPRSTAHSFDDISAIMIPAALLTESSWKQARYLLWTHRRKMALGLVLLVVNRLGGFVLPGSSKWLIDEIVGNQRFDLVLPIALAVGAATFVQAITSYALSQVVGIAAQRAIMDMRKAIHNHVLHLPVRFFDRNRAGGLISRIMSDAEGIRNLVGTGIVMLAGSTITAVIALGVLVYLSWQITLVTVAIVGSFSIILVFALRKLRPIFRLRQAIKAEVLPHSWEKHYREYASSRHIAQRTESKPISARESAACFGRFRQPSEGFLPLQRWLRWQSVQRASYWWSWAHQPLNREQ